jgi:hypothetical protein
MVKCGTVVLLLASTALAAPAQQPIAPAHIELEGPVAFTAHDLHEALAARLPEGIPSGVLHVVARPDGAMELSWESRRRVVELHQESGTSAARVVALLAADLLLPMGLPPPTVEAPRPTASLDPPTIPSPSHARVSLRYQAWSGVTSGAFLQGLELATGLAHRHLRLSASAGYLSGQGTSLLDLKAWPLRLGAGAGLSFGSLLGTVAMVPYRMDGLTQRKRALVGLGVEALLRFPLARGFAIDAVAGYEVYVNRRVEIWAGTARLFAMPTSSFRFGLGLSWGRSR